MSRITFEQYASLPDALDQTGFVVYFPSLPIGAGLSSEQLTLSCMNVSRPGQGNEAFEAAAHGHVRRFRGRKTYPRSLTITFLEVASPTSNYSILKAWDDFCVDPNTGNSGGYKAEYGRDVVIHTLDTVGNIIQVETIESVFPQDIPDVQMDGGSSSPVQISCTFSYDRAVPGVNAV